VQFSDGGIDVKSFHDSVFAYSFHDHPASAVMTRSSSSGVIRKSSVVAQTVLGDRLKAFLRRLHPSKTAMNVAADTGCSAAQVEKWLEAGTLPNCVAMMRLIAAYGPEFLAAMFEAPPAWIVAACVAERGARIDSEIAQREREIDDLKSQARRGAIEGR
jgi:hypothetical protein